MSTLSTITQIFFVGMLYGLQILVLGVVTNVIVYCLTTSLATPKKETFRSLHDKYWVAIQRKPDDEVKKLSEEMFEKFKVLMKNDPCFKINESDEHWCLPINYVFCSKYGTPMVKYMMKLCADVELLNKKGTSNLQYAILMGNTELVQLLLDNGVDINITWLSSMKAFTTVNAILVATATNTLIATSIVQKCKMISFLFENGAKIDEKLMKDYCGDGSPAMWLVTRNLATDKNMREHYALILDTIKLILQNGLDINEVDKTGQTGLIVTAKQSNFDKFRLFVDLGADIEQRDSTGKSALDLATDIGIVKLIMNTINKKMETRITALEKDMIEMSSKLSMSVIEC
jgi:hypothetical protein